MNDARVFRRTRVVSAADIDFLGHVNNARWVAYVAELAGAAAEARGSGADAARERAALWIVRRHEIDYHRPALLGEELVEETWVEKMSGATSERHTRFTRASDQALLCSAITIWAYVDAQTRRPRRIPAELRARFSEKSLADT